MQDLTVISHLRCLEFVLLTFASQKVDYETDCQGDEEKNKKYQNLEISHFAIL